MRLDRRLILSAGALAGSVLALASRGDATTKTAAPLRTPAAAGDGLVPDAAHDQTAALQAAIDAAAERRQPVVLAPGRYLTGRVALRAGTKLIASAGTVTLALFKPGAMLVGEGADGVELSDFTIDGGALPGLGEGRDALVHLKGATGITIDGLTIRNAGAKAISLDACSGRIERCRIAGVGDVAIFSVDARGLAVTGCDIADCGNNGIQVWRSSPGDDGSIVSGNRIVRIASRAGGTGQNGNGVNVFRAAGVTVSGNRITDCAYSAVRGNAASNLSILGNSCARIGEVALYAEFGFEGALISSNIVDGAAAGISVTNFNEGGRLAVVQGNLIRNLKRREHEPVDKRGEGISVEADTNVTGNTIENAPSAGIVIGWGRYMRNVVASGNIVRDCRHGILITADEDAGACFVTGNLISGARDGAIRAVREGGAFGPDLVRQTTDTGRVRITGNMAV
ncbi:MAG: TIGR03808 family TAT-translocated repetitive protein [Hyphomicrobiaceae bacterium]